MDTRFWGPSGWRLLHAIASSYTPRKRAAIRDVFETLPFVLPCKFCRSSLQDYMAEDPLDMRSKDSLSRWLWRIHNKVNAKLREQGTPVAPDPSYAYVAAIRYSKTDTPWDFLFSVADLHPMSKVARHSVPLPNAPDCSSLSPMDPREKNKWNCLTPEERLPYYKRFWVSLGAAMPFTEWKWGFTRTSDLDTRKTTMAWLWRVRCKVEGPGRYSSVCKTLRVHRSGCNKSRRARTCRKIKDKR